MQKIFKLNKENDWLFLDISSKKKVNIKISDEEVNFFLDNDQSIKFEMEYMSNFLHHRLPSDIANRIHKEIGVIVGYFPKSEAVVPTFSTDLFGQNVGSNTKRHYSKRVYKLKQYIVRIYDKLGVRIYETKSSFRTKEEALKFAYGIIDEMGRGMKSSVEVIKI